MSRDPQNCCLARADHLSATFTTIRHQFPLLEYIARSSALALVIYQEVQAYLWGAR